MSDRTPVKHKFTTQCRDTCCPEIEIDTDTQEVQIKDDLGGTIRITAEQFDKLVEFYQQKKDA